jgi:hypothetical protein
MTDERKDKRQGKTPSEPRDLELNRDTVQDLAAGEAEAAAGGIGPAAGGAGVRICNCWMSGSGSPQ